MVGLSPLITSHPSLFQQTPVRSSSRCYPTFNLLMTRSLGFGSNPKNSFRPVQTRFRCAYAYRLKLAHQIKSLTHNTKGTPSRARPRRARRTTDNRRQRTDKRIGYPSSVVRRPSSDRSPQVSPLRLFVGIRFQELFHSPRRGAFHLSLTVLVRYRSLRST